jgi:hypothetical protein
VTGYFTIYFLNSPPTPSLVSRSRVTGQVAELACSTGIDSALVEQTKTYQFGPKRGGVCK